MNKESCSQKQKGIVYEKRTIKRIEKCKGGIRIEKLDNSTVKVINGVKYIVTVEYGKQDIRKLISNLVATEIMLNKHQGEVAQKGDNAP